MTMERLHIFTSAAVNYLPKVRMLCRSIRKHHPEATIHLALADERPAWLTTENEPFDSILEIPQLAIPRWRGWAFGHTIVELSTAIKPFAIRHLLARADCDAVVYFDPDMVLFSRVDDILARLEGANVVLTPHQNKPEKSLQAVIDNELTSLRMGVFNLGFVGVRNTAEGERFAQWWGERCYEFCRAEVHNGIFTDQKWVNFAPIFFDGVEIIKSSRHNVATWNLTTRTLTGDLAHGFEVDGDPLGFYHFTGFDSGAHKIMAVKNASGNQSVQELIEWYARETATRKGDDVEATPWAFARFSDGTRIEKHHRWVYRDRKDLQAAYPDPFDAGTQPMSFLGWCNTEGALRYPEFFNDPKTLAPFPSTFGTAKIKAGMAMRLGLLMLAPRAGKLLRERVMRVLRREGIGGIARRIRGQMLSS
jgi:hypothetical protein